jgi:ribosomal protein S18 acetylase RimI-like enzyme
MPDMLVKLYDLPDPHASLSAQAAQGIAIRKPIGPEHRWVVDWMLRQFSDAWASEAQAALANRPVSCWIAIEAEVLLGVACYDATARGYFGPVGVHPGAQCRGTGTALLRACLHDMRAAGYGYAVIGGVAEPEFYRRSVGATEIPGSSPGLYAGMLRRPAGT